MKLKKIYRCESCGETHITWSGKCPSCGAWNSLLEVVEEVDKKADLRGKVSESKEAKRLIEVESDISQRILTGVDEFDRTIGGGLVRDSFSILAARPGIGKSTLLLGLAESLALRGHRVIYISGEESNSQIKQRALRIMKEIPKEIYLLATNSMDLAIKEIKRLDPQIIFLDSVQTMGFAEYSQRPGSPTQTVECANALADICKNPGKPRAAIMVGHMTKSDQMAGLMTLEHLVDTVLYLEADGDSQLRVLRTSKNRFGYTGEIGLFNMEEGGLKEVENPFEFFLTPRKNPVEGAAVSVIKEGSRVIAVEVESLVSRSFTPYPVRIGDSLKKDQLNTLISILEERAGFSLYDKNVILKTTGGLKLSEQSVNLAIIIAIVSSLKKKSVADRTVFIGEVGLTGELKRVPDMDQRLTDLDRLGFERVYLPKGRYDVKKLKNLKLIMKENINEVIDDVFN